MNSKLMVSALRGASTGAELLRFLDAITGPSESPQQAPTATYGKGQPTLDPVVF
jgi:hypothetical protein